MLDLFGSDYVIDHVMAEAEDYFHEKVYRHYVTEMLRSLVGSWGNPVSMRYLDMIEQKEPEEKQTGDEIALGVIKRAGLKVKQDDTI
jgi:hypothetical protein